MRAVGNNPDNWLECNGQVIDSIKYPKLYKIMHATPNYQGLFLRGYGSQTFSQLNGTLNGITNTTYNSESIGKIQGDAIRNIIGYVSTNSIYIDSTSGAFSPFNNTGAKTGGGNFTAPDDFIFDTSRVIPVANENRPINTAVIYLIRAK